MSGPDLRELLPAKRSSLLAPHDSLRAVTRARALDPLLVSREIRTTRHWNIADSRLIPSNSNLSNVQYLRTRYVRARCAEDSMDPGESRHDIRSRRACNYRYRAFSIFRSRFSGPGVRERGTNVFLSI